MTRYRKMQVLLICFSVVVISCTLEVPDAPVRDNPNDGRNPGAVPEILSMTIGSGSGYINTTTAPIYLVTKAASDVQIGEVASEGYPLDFPWQSISNDTSITISLSQGDGEKWLGYQLRALNGNTSEPAYEMIVVDTECEVDSFYWNASGGDPLHSGDTLGIILQMQLDQLGAEIGGIALANLGNILVDVPLTDNQDGSYSHDYVIRLGNSLEDETLTGSFTDRAGNILGYLYTDQPLNIDFTIVASYDYSGYAKSIEVSGQYAYIADSNIGFKVFGISNPNNPVEVGTIEIETDACDLAISGSHAYVADQEAGLWIIDISDPFSSAIVGFCDEVPNAQGIAVKDDYVYVANGSPGMSIVDVTNPTNPTVVGTYNPLGAAQDVAVSGNFAYVVGISSGLSIVDVANPSNPVLISNEIVSDAERVNVSGDFVYIGTYYYGLKIIDASNPGSPIEISGIWNGNQIKDITILNDYVYTAAQFNGVRVCDVSDPANPLDVGICNTWWAWDVAVSGNFAYVADGGDGLVVLH